MIDSNILDDFDLFDIKKAMRSSRKPNHTKRHVSKESYFENFESQIFLVSKTLKLLRKLSLKKVNEQQLEFFFYTNTPDKAQALAEEIVRLNYSVHFNKLSGDKELYLISGMTIKMSMDDSTITKWSQKMCKLGYRFDCKFDGWGTIVDP